MSIAGPPIHASDDSAAPRVNVRLGPFADPAAAGAAVLVLEDAGIEYFVFPAAEDGSVEISVGVFVDPENAERRRDQVAPLGLGEARIVDYPLIPRKSVEEPAPATPPPSSVRSEVSTNQ